MTPGAAAPPRSPTPIAGVLLPLALASGLAFGLAPLWPLGSLAVLAGVLKLIVW